MPVRFEEADVVKHLDDFVMLLNENRDHAVGRDRFEWLYLDNPHGRARAWMAIDDKTGAPVAFTSVLPRRVRIRHQEMTCWNCCDFSVNKKYRTLGVAVKLRKKAKECVDAGQIPGFYAHPNDRMKVIHEKAGHFCIGEMHRFAKPLTISRQMASYVKTGGGFAKWLSYPVNAVMAAADSILFPANRNYDIRTQPNDRFGKEFDDLFRSVSLRHPVIGDRGSEYLTWRYGKNPLYRTERMEIRAQDKLLGCIIFYCEDDGIGVFKDMICLDEGDAADALLAHWIRLLRKRGMDSVSAVLMNTNPMIKTFLKLGFRLRPETSSVFAYMKETIPAAEDWLNGAKWYMTVGDRDV